MLDEGGREITACVTSDIIDVKAAAVRAVGHLLAEDAVTAHLAATPALAQMVQLWAARVEAAWTDPQAPVAAAGWDAAAAIFRSVEVDTLSFLPSRREDNAFVKSYHGDRGLLEGVPLFCGWVLQG